MNFVFPHRRSASVNSETNILLLGQTGVGKSTFINAFANALLYDTLGDALRNDLKVLVSSSFSITDSETFEETLITVGEPSDNENHKGTGESSTQACRAYVFQIGHRRVRLIDAPGIGDTRGVEWDDKNFAGILAYISQHEHLNGICILLKPNMTRLDVYFRYCIKELLRHLHVNAIQNLMFVFTNARTTFFKPGDSAKLLKEFLKDLEKKTGVVVPFNQDNSFMFDNESFRFLAVRQQIRNYLEEEKSIYEASWNRSVKEYSRLIERILRCDAHSIRDTKSLNQAQQLIHRLARPVAETARLIEENILLAEQYKKNILKSGEMEGMPQKEGNFVPLEKRLTVCVNPKCTRLVETNGEIVVDYHTRCHDGCLLHNAKQECIGDPVLRNCWAMTPEENCRICGCHWTKHMHITYQFATKLTHLQMTRDSSQQKPTPVMSLIDQRIAALWKEGTSIRRICKELSGFLKANAIAPINDDLTEYLRHFVQEEKQKRSMKGGNDAVIRNLEQMIEEHTSTMALYNETSRQDNTLNLTTPNEIETIFELVKELYSLPINGKFIREQVEGIEKGQCLDVESQEVIVDMQRIHQTSQIFSHLRRLL